jgi:hypothetical protein
MAGELNYNCSRGSGTRERIGGMRDWSCDFFGLGFGGMRSLLLGGEVVTQKFLGGSHYTI